MTDDVFARIEEKLPVLSKGQKSIASYILSSCDKAAFMTASALGRTVQVSESSVVRFAALVGYEGYPQLQRALQQTVLSRLNGSERSGAAEEHTCEEDLLASVLREDAERLRTTAEKIDRTAFAGAVNALRNARRIYVHGVQDGAALARFLYGYLQYIAEDVHLLTAASEGELFERLLRVSPRDTLLSVGFPHENAALRSGVLHCKQSGAKTVVLTDFSASALQSEADYMLCADCGSVSCVNSVVAAMSVSNALLLALTRGRQEETEQTFARLKELRDRYFAYEKQSV